jgi:hypothetical protein
MMTEPNINADGRTDFDFLLGTWQVHNRRLRERLVDCQEWEEFLGVAQVRTVLGGLGNVDEITFTRATGPMQGLSLRLFNPQTREWSIYWSDDQTGVLFPPMIGRFVNGVGEFYAQEVHQQQTVLSRFIWSDITGNTAHWAQALSADGGRTWETNWTMALTRS